MTIKIEWVFLLAAVAVAALAAAVAGANERQARWVWVEATAYCPCAICCGKHANGVTATGRGANTPGVAVDPTVIPLGSRLDIPGYRRSNGTWILADDTGGAIKGNRIDVRFETHEEARQWGRRRIRVRVWE